jgi:hypothetical protein
VSSPSRHLKNAVWVLLLAGIAIALTRITLDAHGTGDYGVHSQVLGDNAGPALTALIHGHLAALARVQTLMGLTSLIWRAPFAAFAHLLGGDDARVYDAGAFACLLPVAGVFVWLGRRTGDRRQLGAAALAAGAILAGPVTSQALLYGHPEELLVGALATGAVLCAIAQRRGWAAVLLGLAIGTKQWALLAAPCVLVAVSAGRGRLAARALLVAVPLIVVLPLADPAAFSQANAGVGAFHLANPMSAWWPVDARTLRPSATLEHLLPFGLTRLRALAIGLALAAAAIIVYGWLVGARRRTRVDALALLALVCVLRCEFDPLPTVYYFFPAVLTLAVWEVESLRRLPVVTVALCAWLALLPNVSLDPRTFDVLWLGGMLGLAIYLARAAVGPPAAPVSGPVPGLQPLVDTHTSA